MSSSFIDTSATGHLQHDPFAAPGALTPPGSQPIVAISGLEKYFGRNHVLRGCTLEVFPRETICLIGRSGSGKSTSCAASTSSRSRRPVW